jgi:hypothetical protein
MASSRSISRVLFAATIAAAVAFAFAAILGTTGCGIKGDPIAPKKISIPPVADLDGWLRNGTVVLRWTPTLAYSDGTPLEVRHVEIYRLNEELGERLMQQEERELEQRQAVAEAGMAVRSDVSDRAAGMLNLRVNKLAGISPQYFEGRSRLAATLPVEQLLDRVSGNKIVWQEKLALPEAPLPGNRCVYAVRIVDARGRRSELSNFTFIYPLQSPPAPRGLTSTMTQDRLTLLWDSPDRSVAKFLEFALVGYNVYRSEAGAAAPPLPANATPLPTPPPLDWTPEALIAHQRLSGENGRFEYLFATDAKPGSAGIWQVIYPPEQIAQKIGQEVDIEIEMRSVGDESSGRIVLDGAVDPKTPTVVSGSDIFKEEENPLIRIEEIRLTNQFDTYRLSAKVPVGAVAWRLRLEPRGIAPVSASYVVRSVRVTERGAAVNLIRNGDFSSFGPLQYSEEIKSFGSAADFRVSAVYRVAGNLVESAVTGPVNVQFTDTFPPDSPGGVRAQATFDTITITWNASRAKDLRGYHVYRQEPGEARWRKLTEQPISQTIYRDQEVKGGIIYAYRIEAVDRHGNASVDATTVTAQLLERGK